MVLPFFRCFCVQGLPSNVSSLSFQYNLCENKRRPWALLPLGYLVGLRPDERSFDTCLLAKSTHGESFRGPQRRVYPTGCFKN